MNFLSLLISLTLVLGASARGQAPTNAPAPQIPIEGYLRIWCTLPGDQKPEVFGEWPRFRKSLRLVTGTEKKEAESILVSQLLPLSTYDYRGVPPRPIRVLVQETDPPATPSGQPVGGAIKASVPLQAKAGQFYTLVLLPKDGKISHILLEDEPAVLPSQKPGQEPPPPSRSLRVFVFEPGLSVLVSCSGAGVQIKASVDQPGRAKNLKAGLWTLDLKGDFAGQPYANSVEFDLNEPGNWSLFLMKDIYDRVVPFLQKDAILP